MSLAGVVLSGGRSARMGTPKALLDFRGQPFVVRILEVLEALDLKTRVLVLGPDAARIRAAVAAHECLIVENPDVDGGPIA
ncbi:MAG TPA: NTP transferase domain-containing protein, partial [Gemmatimonadales bacterium]